ncbi:STAS domain-containing protein [Streptomyces sp. MMBL 11-3]|uniref:STAS domain-containing protein n=1 Tax=Streptomyces sp. MMBL 11-3 TaxID=3382639 RepID=UPI0039B5C25F
MTHPGQPKPPQEGNAYLITPRGEIDNDTAAPLRQELLQALHSPQPSTLVDLSQITFGDTALLNTILQAHQDHTAHGKPLRFSGPLHRHVARLLHISRADTVLDLPPTD